MTTTLPLADPTTYEAWSLGAQWAVALAALGYGAVAVVLAVITLATSRRSKDTQQRATLTAASDHPNQSQSPLAENGDAGRASFTVRHKAGERWLLVNDGPNTAYGVQIEGLTELDNMRLQEVSSEPHSPRQGDAREFVLVSRLTLSGPANIRVSFRLEPGGPECGESCRCPRSRQQLRREP